MSNNSESTPIASAQEAGAPDGADRGDDLVVNLTAQSHSPEANSAKLNVQGYQSNPSYGVR